MYLSGYTSNFSSEALIEPARNISIDIRVSISYNYVYLSTLLNGQNYAISLVTSLSSLLVQPFILLNRAQIFIRTLLCVYLEICG